MMHIFRRPLAIASVALIAIGLAGCAPGPGTPTDSPAPQGTGESGTSTALDAVEISGGFGAEPSMTPGDPTLVSGESEQVILESGTGPEVEGSSSPALRVAVFDYESGETLSPYSSIAPAGALDDMQLPEPLKNALIGAKSGSRVAVLVSTANEVQQPQPEGATAPTVVYVIDIVTVQPNQAADGTPTGAELDWVSVSDDAGAEPEVKITNADAAPSDQVTEVVLAGEGATVREGDEVVLQYRGMLLDGTEFDSSWGRGGVPAMFATTQVVPGFGNALVDQRVGSRIVTVFPPELGYGDADQGSIPPNSTLVFVVDILGVFPGSPS